MERHRVMVEKDRLDWYNFLAKVNHSLNRNQFQLVCELHSKYFKHKFYKPCTCNPKVIKQWISDITKLYDKKEN
jgi:hypothetical protein